MITKLNVTYNGSAMMVLKCIIVYLESLVMVNDLDNQKHQYGPQICQKSISALTRRKVLHSVCVCAYLFLLHYIFPNLQEHHSLSLISVQLSENKHTSAIWRKEETQDIFLVYYSCYLNANYLAGVMPGKSDKKI